MEVNLEEEAILMEEVMCYAEMVVAGEVRTVKHRYIMVLKYMSNLQLCFFELNQYIDVLLYYPLIAITSM